MKPQPRGTGCVNCARPDQWGASSGLRVGRPYPGSSNSIRPAKLGMKNWMFIGNEKTGWRSAVIYTFVEQIRCHGKDPFAYFEWVFGKLMHNPAPEELPGLLPAAWLKAQSEPAIADDTAAA